jgi:hypothetical protein
MTQQQLKCDLSAGQLAEGCVQSRRKSSPRVEVRHGAGRWAEDRLGATVLQRPLCGRRCRCCGPLVREVGQVHLHFGVPFEACYGVGSQDVRWVVEVWWRC